MSDYLNVRAFRTGLTSTYNKFLVAKTEGHEGRMIELRATFEKWWTLYDLEIKRYLKATKKGLSKKQLRGKKMK